MNPGPWVAHSRLAGEAAARIAARCPHLDARAAESMGLMHDIGRRFGAGDGTHGLDGYRFMTELGYDDCARICMTHSFLLHRADAARGGFGGTPEQQALIRGYLEQVEYDDYDRLIQLCDYLAHPDGLCILEKRMVDVAMRKGVDEWTLPVWRRLFELKAHFDRLTGCDLYSLLDLHF